MRTRPFVPNADATGPRSTHETGTSRRVEPAKARARRGCEEGGRACSCVVVRAGGRAGGETPPADLQVEEGL